MKNGEYVIFKDPHKRSDFSFDFCSTPIPVVRHVTESSVDSIETRNLGTISSESQAIDYTNIISVLKSFTGESNLNLTIRGKSRSGSFQGTLPDDPDTSNNGQLVGSGGIRITITLSTRFPSISTTS